VYRSGAGRLHEFRWQSRGSTPEHADLTASTSRHQENLTTGQHYFGHLFSTGPVPAGESVTAVVAGTRSFDITSANDVEVHSASNFQWFINSVEIRIAP
jgi:hypothetical protein